MHRIECPRFEHNGFAYLAFAQVDEHVDALGGGKEALADGNRCRQQATVGSDQHEAQRPAAAIAQAQPVRPGI